MSMIQWKGYVAGCYNKRIIKHSYHAMTAGLENVDKAKLRGKVPKRVESV